MNVGIFGPLIKRAYDRPGLPASIVSPYSSQDSLVKVLADDLFPADVRDRAAAAVAITRDTAMMIPAVARAHGVHVTQFAENPFYVMDGDNRAAVQPRWTSTTSSGIPPFIRWSGVGDDLFWEGWALLAFTEDGEDCIHVPWGMWGIRADRTVWVDPAVVPVEYRARLIPLTVGPTWRGILHTGTRAIDQARKIEDAYQKRLENPIPLTIMNIPLDIYQGMDATERKRMRDEWTEGRRRGEVGMKPTEFGIEMPGQISTDLYETGRNGSRLDIANATATPADLLEGAKQGGSGGTTMRYQGVGEGGVTRSDLWDFGLAKRFTLAVEARLSMDDVVAPGLSVRADRAAVVSAPTPATNPTSED